MINNQLLENEKINYSPMVLCNTLFNTVKNETDIQGYWQDKNGQLYIDNIELKTYFAIETSYFNLKIKDLFKQGEIAIFYKNIYNEGIIAYPNGKTETLKTRIEIIENKKPSIEYIKELLKNNNGLTVYKIDNGQFLIEIYK